MYSETMAATSPGRGETGDDDDEDNEDNDDEDEDDEDDDDIDDRAGGGEDAMTKKAEENMSKIAGDFCNWLRDLPGEDRAVNSLGESQLRVLL